jgi:multisubunit Na+/H+ antiporter MnhG subunit
MRYTLIGTVLGAIATLLVALIMLPVISFSFLGIIFLAGVFSIIGIIGGFIGQDVKAINYTHTKVFGAILVLSLGYFVVGSIGSSAIFHAAQKQGMLEVEEVVFDESVPNVDMDNLIIWDESDAIRFGEKLITEKDASLGSMYYISKEYGTLSVIDGKPNWLFPLEHSGFFKYMANKTIPGYIKVNATTGDAAFIDSEFSVAPSAAFSNDLKRVVYKTFKNVGLTDYSFEEDEEGNPKWVITAYTHKTWLSTSDVVGVIIVDPVSKETDFFKKDEQPQWVDRVSSMDIFSEQLSNWGEYVNGWWNPSDQGKLQNTSGIGYVFKEGNLYFYTGITSYGGDEATTGFLIYNPRTCNAVYNRISGSTEQKAMGLMEELVQNAGYTAKYPYLVNINGEATYLSTLKGNSGNVVGYALSSVENYRAVAWGKSLREAQTQYNRILIAEGASTNSLSDQFDSLKKVSGAVSRVGAFKEGYFIIKVEEEDLLFVVSADQYPRIALTEKGDQVVISFLKTDETLKIDAINFENNSIK